MLVTIQSNNFKHLILSCLILLNSAAHLLGQDCDEDGILDVDEINMGLDSDFNDDGYPDSCQDPKEVVTGSWYKPTTNRFYFCITNEDLGPVLEEGTEIDLEVKFEVRTPGIAGWSFGVQHDHTKLDFLEVSSEGLQFPKLFFETHKYALNHSPQGFISAVLLSIHPEQVTLEPNQTLTVVRAKYRVLETLSPNNPTLIKFTNRLTEDGPSTQTAMTINQRTYRPQYAFPLGLGLRAFPLCSNWKTPEFLRGDASNDSKTNLSDGILILKNLFQGPVQNLHCEDSHDVNDDGILNISDPIHLLTWLFLDAPTPPPPFSECGFDFTLDELQCQSTCP